MGWGRQGFGEAVEAKIGGGGGRPAQCPSSGMEMTFTVYGTRTQHVVLLELSSQNVSAAMVRKRRYVCNVMQKYEPVLEERRDFVEQEGDLWSL